MSERQLKAMALSSRIRKRIRSRLLCDNDFRALRWVRYWNAVHRVAFPGMPDMTQGQFLDDLLEQEAFEVRL